MEENEKKDMNVYTFEKNENIDGNMVLVNVNGKLKNEFLKEINKNFEYIELQNIKYFSPPLIKNSSKKRPDNSSL